MSFSAMGLVIACWVVSVEGDVGPLPGIGDPSINGFDSPFIGMGDAGDNIRVVFLQTGEEALAAREPPGRLLCGCAAGWG